MSFDLFVHRYRDGESAPYPRRIAEEIFDRGALAPSGLQSVEYSDGRGKICCARAEEDFDGFMLTHFGGHTICARALEIADVTQSLIFYPADYVFLAVTDRATLAHLPSGVMAQRERVALVRSVDELLAAINATEGRNDGVDLVFP